jgi:hypothetical protein
MMDFATDQEHLEVTKKLVGALRKPNGIQHFKDRIRTMDPTVLMEWIAFRDEKIQHFIKDKLIKIRHQSYLKSKRD